MSLLARHFEARGLPTLILGSALDILESGRPPRVKFLDFPLGFEAGPPFDHPAQVGIMREALSGFESMTSPGIEPMHFRWPEGWEMIRKREAAQVGDDSRSPRNTAPQYQNEADRIAAEASR